MLLLHPFITQQVANKLKKSLILKIISMYIVSCPTFVCFILLKFGLWMYVGRCTSTYYGETERHLKVRSGKHIRRSRLTFRETKPFKESSMNNHHLQCDKNPSFDEFTILTHRNKKYLLEIKESLFIKYDQPVLKTIARLRLLLYLTRVNVIG